MEETTTRTPKPCSPPSFSEGEENSTLSSSIAIAMSIAKCGSNLNLEPPEERVLGNA